MKPTPLAIRRSFTAATIGWSWSRKEPSAPTWASAAGSPLSVAVNWGVGDAQCLLPQLGELM